MTFQFPNAQDDSDRKLLADVKKYGWHIVSIEEEADSPSFSFSVGLHYSFKHPEILVMGLKPEVAIKFINFLGTEIKSGKNYVPGSQHDDIAVGYPTAFVKFGKHFYRDYLGYALWFYQSKEFPALQLIWCDSSGKFPWDDAFDGRLFQRQLVLSEDSTICWPFFDAKNTAVFAHSSIFKNEAEILHVYHDKEDGAWQFLDGVSTNDPANAQLVGLANVVKRDQSILLLGDLPYGWRAVRSMRGEPWHREPVPE